MDLTEQHTARWKLLGPGIVAAATGVGTGDLVATLVAGNQFGYTLMWAVVVGAMVKIALAEAAGRWHLASESTIFHGWSTLGRWTHVYFAPYIIIWGFVYGATAMSASALPLATLFPVLPLEGWAVICSLTGLVFVWLNRYAVFEKVITALVGLMFVTIVGLALYIGPDVVQTVKGLRPLLPRDSAMYTMGLVGGVGGTITMAAYGYWVNAKGWRDATWIRMMRLDNSVAYITTGIFVLATLVVGAELLHASGIVLTEDDKGLVDLAAILEQRFGPVISTVFLVGFFAAAFSSLLGVWHGVSLMFADFMGHIRGKVNRPVAERERSWEFRAYVLWLSIPPMVLLQFERPFALAVIYGVVGAFFMPFLALTLLWLLNSSRVPRQWRNGWLSNTALGVAGTLFLALCLHELWNQLTSV
ncbi:Mn2+/Fe2+ NRAMP family transporter [Haloactinospora alba]|uniref:Mn2+/Fe2+ NRAMP family transporter n=1 Tax=Haloactinospora alba TaxID=405555 RepID=A0A543NGA5_9ACTN|nr:Nramp family divalent metal transporter [Haloactinospora alba]TQN30824.1 Mn2+/Fe2+ NRAMP family transporter [Haloactinospora alba]